MPSYRQTTYNDFETPSGAVGEAPDGPGAFAHVMDQVDVRLSFGGAEYCANASALGAIPASRAFPGKLAYRADTDTVFRYAGAGNTALGSNDSTHWWQAWEKPATVYTPAWAVGLTLGSSTAFGLWGISAGKFWTDVAFTAGSGYTLSNASDVVLTAVSPYIGALGGGSGQYQRGASSANNSQVALSAYGIGALGNSSTQIRIRAIYVPAAAGPATQNVLGSVITPTTTDTFQVHFDAPSALVA